MKLFRLSFLIFISTTLFFSCEEQSRLDVDVSNIKAAVKIQRYEQDLFSIHPDSLLQKQFELHEKYGSFYKLYVEQILNAGSVEDPTLGYNLKLFTSDYDVKEIYKATKTEFENLDTTEKELEEAFKHYKYYFPDNVIPEVVSYISAFEVQNFVYDSLIGIGLDMYLGKGYKFYQGRFPMYQQQIMSKEFIAADCMKNWLSGMFFFEEKGKNLLDYMIYQGKILYLTDAMMPNTHDSIKIGYSEKELEWCDENEYNIWTHFVNKELFFSTKAEHVRDYINPSPFTKGFPEGSPGRVGLWEGWQIVRAFMKNNPKVSLLQLMETDNSQAILNKSKYKPK